MVDINGQLNRPGSEVNHTVASHFARAHLRNAEQLGMSAQQLIVEAQLSSSLLREPEVRISPHQLAMLYKAIWRIRDDEYFGLTESPIKLGVFELIAERMIACESLHEALLQAMRIYNLVSDNVKFSLQPDDDLVRYTVALKNPDLDKENVLMEFLLLVWHRFPSWLVGEVLPLREIQFTYRPPKHLGEYRLLYPGPCVFSQPCNALVWPIEVLDWPIRRNAKQLTQYLHQVPLPWFLKQRYAESVTDKVIYILEEAPYERLATLDEVAQTMHMTPRTLRRKLSAENSSFKNLKDKVRRDRAIYWLSQENVSVAEASRYSGYTESTAFIRAFRHWTGITPGDYRKRLFKIS